MEANSFILFIIYGTISSMPNAFETHNIGHLSASSINMFAAEPALWIMERLLGKRGNVGPAAHRGTAAEAGIVHGLLDPVAPLAECQSIALVKFDQLTALSTSPRRDKEREAIPGIVDQGLQKLRQAGIPDEIQQRIEVTLDDVPVPFLGFVDVGWTKHDIRLDIKTQLRLSSEISAAHARQVSLYVHGTNFTGRLGYFTPLKCAVYVLDDVPQHVNAVRQIAIRMEKLLSISRDPQEIAGLVVPNYDSFYWSDSATRAMGQDTFGF